MERKYAALITRLKYKFQKQIGYKFAVDRYTAGVGACPQMKMQITKRFLVTIGLLWLAGTGLRLQRYRQRLAMSWRIL